MLAISECEEFPYRATEEGGPSASLKMIEKVQNQRQGSFYRRKPRSFRRWHFVMGG